MIWNLLLGFYTSFCYILHAKEVEIVPKSKVGFGSVGFWVPISSGYQYVSASEEGMAQEHSQAPAQVE